MVLIFLFLLETLSWATPYSQVKDFLNKVANEHPQNASIFELGKSNDNEKIFGLKIGTGPVHNLVVATHHGNEYGSTEVAKAFAEDLAKNPLPDQTIYVIPVLNTSGYNKGLRNELNQDPNRDYPGPCKSASSFKLKSTQALANFIEKNNITASATLHTHYPVVAYPWGFSTHDTVPPNESVFKNLAHYSTIESGYQIGNSTEIIYPADGTYEDFIYWKWGVWSLLFELGFTHSPTPAQIAEMVKVNIPGLRRFLENAPITRAEDHAFRGKCDMSLRALDRHDE